MGTTHRRRTVLRGLATPTAALVLLTGLGACGGDDEPDVSAPAPVTTPTSTAQDTPATTTLKPVSYPDPFAGVRDAAEHMPDLAKTLAVGFAKASDAPGADTAAAELTGSLQHLLTEYVFLSALAMDIELVKPDDPKNSDSLAELDKNTVALADAIDTVATPAQRTAFLTGWREQSKAMISAAISNDPGVDEAAVKVINAYPAKAAKLLGQISDGELDTDEVATALGEQLGALREAHQAVKNRQDNAYRKLYAVASGMSGFASMMATGLAQGGDLAGDPKSAGAVARGTFAHLLTSHTYLAVTSVLVNYSPPGVLEIEASNGVALALGDNSTDLTDTVGALAPDHRSQFDQSWAGHINDFVAYSNAARAKDTAARTRALASLEAYRSAAGTLFADATKGALKAGPVAKSLETHIEALVGTIDALAKRMA